MKRLWRYLAQMGRMMVGVPPYDAYLAHMARAHPDVTPMDPAAFFRNRQDARYGGKNGGRCC